MADVNMDNMITEIDLDDETVAQVLEDEEVGEKCGNEDAVCDAADMMAEINEEELMQEQSQEHEEEQAAEADGTESQEEDGDSNYTQRKYGLRLFIGGLHLQTKNEDLRLHFGKYGKLKECYIVRTTQRYGSASKGRPRGFGFVTMSTLEATENILKDAHIINNKVVQVTVSKPNDAPERRLRLSLFHLDKNKTTKESLMAHFGQFGTVTDGTISMEQLDGETVSRGIGFVTMATEEEMQAVLNGNVEGHQMIDEKRVLVKSVVVDGIDANKDTTTKYGPRLFIGGLHFKTKDEDLRQHFKKYGQLKECFIVTTKQRYGEGRPRGFGYVTMATQEETDLLLKDTHVIHDKALSVMVSKPRDDPERRLRLSLFHLDKEKTTMESLMAHFSQFGDVKHCTVSMEQVDGETVSQGIGFVTMTTEEELQAILKRNVDGHQRIDEKSVLVKRVVGDGKNHDNLQSLWIGGFDQEKTTESDIREYFSSFGTVQDCIIARDPPIKEGVEGRSKGYGFITMANTAETGAILKHLEEHRIHGMVLVFNRPFQKLKQPDVDVPLIKLIKVTGLRDSSLTEDDLSLYFSTHGSIRYITIKKGNNTALVGFDKIEDADKLAQMRDHYIQKYWLIVEKADEDTVKAEKAFYKTNKPNERNERGRSSKSQHSNRRQGEWASQSRKDRYRFDDGYNDGPRHGGSFQYEDDYYGEDSSSYGPMRGSSSRGADGGWVFVENLYGQRDDRFQRPSEGFRGMRQQSSFQDPDSGYGGFEGGNIRNRRRGRGRPY